MVPIGSVPETSGDKSLVDAEDSEDAYPFIMLGEEAGSPLCSLTGMFKIHLLYESGIKVHVPGLCCLSLCLYCLKILCALLNLELLYSAMTQREEGGEEEE